MKPDGMHGRVIMFNDTQWRSAVIDLLTRHDGQVQTMVYSLKPFRMVDQNTTEICQTSLYRWVLLRVILFRIKNTHSIKLEKSFQFGIHIRTLQKNVCRMYSNNIKCIIYETLRFEFSFFFNSPTKHIIQIMIYQKIIGRFQTKRTVIKILSKTILNG